MDNIHTSRINGVIYSCYTRMSREGENFIPEHVFTYLESGTLLINDGRHEYRITAGDFAVYAKNSLAKFTKLPDAQNGEYKALSLRMDAATLVKVKEGFTAPVEKDKDYGTVIKLESNDLFTGFAQSLITYINSTEQHNEQLMALKVQEITLLLLKIRPDLAGLLFDFKEPGKTDLKAFMLANFNFNVSLERFAYLTGRSLSTFKRDFEKIFHTTPNRWLQQKRLEEARYLITEKGKKATDVYIEVGFENLSHFSFAFKKAFGKAPSQFTQV